MTNVGLLLSPLEHVTMDACWHARTRYRIGVRPHMIKRQVCKRCHVTVAMSSEDILLHQWRTNALIHHQIPQKGFLETLLDSRDFESRGGRGQKRVRLKRNTHRETAHTCHTHVTHTQLAHITHTPRTSCTSRTSRTSHTSHIHTLFTHFTHLASKHTHVSHTSRAYTRFTLHTCIRIPLQHT